MLKKKTIFYYFKQQGMYSFNSVSGTRIQTLANTSLPQRNATQRKSSQRNPLDRSSLAGRAENTTMYYKCNPYGSSPFVVGYFGQMRGISTEQKRKIVFYYNCGDCKPERTL